MEKEKKEVERGDTESEGSGVGRREIGLGGEIKRKWKGAEFERKHTYNAERISGMDFYHAINMRVPGAISHQQDKTVKRGVSQRESGS